MKFFETDFTYKHDWDQVTTAVWKKYPNKMTKHVLSVDTLSSTVDPVTGLLKVERLITCRQNIPYIILGNDVSYIHEVTTVDPKNKDFTAKSVNISFKNLMNIEETVNYKPCENSPSSTIFQQQAQCTALGALSRLASVVEDMSVNRFRDNSVKGREALNSVLEHLFGTENHASI